MAKRLHLVILVFSHFSEPLRRNTVLYLTILSFFFCFKFYFIFKLYIIVLVLQFLFLTPEINFEWKYFFILRVHCTARISNQSILKEIHPECSLEGLMLKLKQQYFGHLRRRVYSLENTLILRKIECRKRRWWQRMKWIGWHHWLNEHEFEQ